MNTFCQRDGFHPDQDSEVTVCGTVTGLNRLSSKPGFSDPGV